MESNIIGFHTNNKKKIKNFIEKGIPIISEDITWLGRGMYFWDNISNAKYWKNEKIRKGEVLEKDIDIIKANIIIDDILDLTDKETCEAFNYLWNGISYKKRCKIKDNELGKKIELIFEMYSYLKESIKVIKCFGNYKNNIDKFDFLNGSRLTLNSKTIYCVIDYNCIKNPKIIENY